MLIHQLRSKDEKFDILGKTGDQNGIAKSYIFETTAEYDALTPEEKEAAWTAICKVGTMTSKQYTYNIGAKFGSTTASTAVKVFCYEEFGLGSLLSSEIGFQLQRRLVRLGEGNEGRR